MLSGRSKVRDFERSEDGRLGRIRAEILEYISFRPVAAIRVRYQRGFEPKQGFTQWNRDIGGSCGFASVFVGFVFLYALLFGKYA